ncbi:uncharacterized protein PgNI_05066 [Pyricularia grisea]|uniref:Uncharacterized protein n=1 Tax=Pyricularia grisea TaxID=148305 RepID=A0A6P8B9Z2_PYRGI|nr:uncharacterized protein PgNI_05066 [Pyricularia grisea]TLD12631.1 hypothetical protein PgNI_05066 [Pyricularia grisea]
MHPVSAFPRLLLFVSSVVGLSCNRGHDLLWSHIGEHGYASPDHFQPFPYPKQSFDNADTDHVDDDLMPKNTGWTRDEIWRQLKPNGLPDSMSKDKIDHTLFICQDRRYWTNADLQYKDYCLRGCQDRGSGKDDACYAAVFQTAVNGTVEAVNGTLGAVKQVNKTATAVVKRATVLLAWDLQGRGVEFVA